MSNSPNFKELFIYLDVIHLLIPDTVDAYERIWIIGDKFVESTFAQYFQNVYGDNMKKSYLKAHYDVTGYCPGTEFLNGNILSRLRNALTAAINKQQLFPKAILIVLESDLLDSLKHKKPGISDLMGRTIEWLFNQFHRMVITYKEKLPSKSRKFKYPTILWSSLPLHKDWERSGINEYRMKFNTCLKNTVSLFREMEFLPIKWDDLDEDLLVDRRMSSKGLTTYWSALNDAFESWDKEQMKSSKIQLGINKNPVKNQNRYREAVAENGKFKWKIEKTRFKLPKPKPSV